MNVRKCFHYLMLITLTASAWAGDSVDDGQHVIYLDDDGVIVLRFQIQIDGKSSQEAFEQYVDDLMKSIDVNHDGIVTTDEARGKLVNQGDPAVAPVFSKRVLALGEVIAAQRSPDVSPADGKISRSEFISYFKRIGLLRFAIYYQPNSTSLPARRGGRQAVISSEIPFFNRLDVDGDGKLSRDELANGFRTLRKLDLNDDETISAAEISQTNSLPGGQPQMANSTMQSPSPFLGLGSNESLSKQVREMIEKYDRADTVNSRLSGSVVRNQKLSRQELRVTIDTFKKFDGDGNAQLDFDELRQFLMSPDTMVTIMVDVDTAEPLKAESILDSFRGRLSNLPDGSANINLGTTQLSIVRQAAYDGGNAEAFLKPQFMAVDTDGNGYLEKLEAEQMFLYGMTFESLDTDNNGKVFFDEALAQFKIQFDAARSRTVLTISDQGRTLFEILDTDRDQRLSFRELQAAKEKLSIWDKDGDGLLSESEVPHQYRLTITRGNLLNVGGVFVNRSMNQAGELPEKTTGPIWFRKMDKNRDGEVSHREFLGDSAEFKKFDRNHDGFIDLSESIQMISE